MVNALSYDLHKLTARLDRAADALLREEQGVSYARFLCALGVAEVAGTQRELARWLGQSEPSTSRMVRVLVSEGFLEAVRSSGSGNRKDLRLTPKGRDFIQRAGRLLEGRFEELLRRSAVPLDLYQEHTRCLLLQLESEQQSAGTQSVRTSAA
jgi:DNA-binding MarR family transcriptional regulator